MGTRANYNTINKDWTSYRYTNTFSKVNECVLALYNAIPAALSYFRLSAITVDPKQVSFTIGV